MNTIIILLASGIGSPPAALLHCPVPIAARGDVKGGPPLAQSFELTNRSPGTLSITSIEAGCGCLRQSLSTGVLAPGETAKLTLEVNTLTQPDGPNRWQAVVRYRVETPGMPPQVGELLLQITAALSREIAVTPPQLGFSTTGAASQSLSVADRRAKPLTILKATSSSPHLAVEIAPRVAGKDQSVAVKLDADAPAGHRDETVVLLTDDPVYPELRVPVRVHKRAAGSVAAAPESVSVRFARGQAEVSTLVQLRAANGKPISISAAASDVPAVAVKWAPGAGTVAIVRVTVTEAAATRDGSCLVRIKLADPAGQEIVLPVAWTAAK